MWTSIVGLCQSTSETRKMMLKDKLRTIRKTKSDTVVSYLSKFTQVRDELAGMGETTPDTELMCSALMGFTEP